MPWQQKTRLLASAPPSQALWSTLIVPKATQNGNMMKSELLPFKTT
jgi:hypothetical protein